jgi:hypothetical protein
VYVAAQFAGLLMFDARWRAGVGSGSYHWALVEPGNRYFWLGRRVRGEETRLTRPAPSADINGGNATNRLELVCVGNTISLAVNGRRVASVEDDTYRMGWVDIGAGVFSERTEIVQARFDNLVLTQRSAPPSSQPTPDATPTATPGPGATLTAIAAP